MTPSILRLPYDVSLTVAGIEYAKKSLHYTYNRMRLPAAARLRKIVAGVAVELAFRRWLEAEHVPYDLLGATPFTERDRYDLRLGGRRCDVKSFLIGERADISRVRRDPDWLLEAEALVPEDQFASDTLGENDFYLFGFLAGLETRRRTELEKALLAEQPVYLLYTVDNAAWLGSAQWRSLGRLVLKADLPAALEVEVGGQDAARLARAERLHLGPRERTVTAGEFYSLLYLHPTEMPGGTMGVRSAVLKDTVLVPPERWENIWVYGIEIFLAGWLTKAEFRGRGRKLPARTPVRQYPRGTQTENRAVPVGQLRDVRELAELIRKASR
jgi:hypothetical protein